ncbi:MAG: helix-turn-helix transcriptional regulator [Cytophagales bacterium]|nr:helix-turn-helix transcriptional regulator [Cytophagales bacterium]
MERTTPIRPKHIGRKIMQMRELLGVKQEAIAEKLGVSQQAVSKIEQKEEVDEDTMTRVAKALGVSTESIKNLDEEATVYNIVTQKSMPGTLGKQDDQKLNLLEKWMEAMEEIKNLYQQLLKSEREKVALLQQLLGEKK